MVKKEIAKPHKALIKKDLDEAQGKNMPQMGDSFDFQAFVSGPCLDVPSTSRGGESPSVNNPG